MFFDKYKPSETRNFDTDENQVFSLDILRITSDFAFLTIKGDKTICITQLKSHSSDANLALFMTNTSYLLVCWYRQDNTNFSSLGLRAYFRGYRCLTETVKMFSQKADDCLVSQVFFVAAALCCVLCYQNTFSVDLIVECVCSE